MLKERMCTNRIAVVIKCVEASVWSSEDVSRDLADGWIHRRMEKVDGAVQLSELAASVSDSD